MFSIFFELAEWFRTPQAGSVLPGRGWPLITHNSGIRRTLRLVVMIPVAVEKLASKKSGKIRTRQEAPQTIFSSRPDIFYLAISAYFEKKGLFQQPLLFPPSISD